jgi:hypothetical protein
MSDTTPRCYVCGVSNASLQVFQNARLGHWVRLCDTHMLGALTENVRGELPRMSGFFTSIRVELLDVPEITAPIARGILYWLNGVTPESEPLAA